jgi:hypothetical protein
MQARRRNPGPIAPRKEKELAVGIKRILFYAFLLLAAFIPLALLSLGEGGRLALMKTPEPPAALTAGGYFANAFAASEESDPEIAEYAVPAAGENTAVLDDALKAIFNGSGRPPRTEATLLEILRYVPQVTRLEFLGSPRGSDCLAAGKSFCTGMALAFTALCRRAGFPARANAFHNFEWMMAHNAAEVYYDGAWHYFDPTYGVFYYTSDTYGEGRVPALSELLVNPALRRHAFMVTDPAHLWQAAHHPDDPLRPLPADWQYGNYDFTIGELFDQVFSRAFPVIQSENQTASFPLVCDLQSARTLEFGEADGDILDTLGRLPSGAYPVFHGWPVIGEMRLGASMLTVSIRMPEAGRCRLVLGLLPGTGPENLQAIPLRHVAAESIERSENRWILTCRVQDREGVLQIVNPGASAHCDFIRAERLPETETLPDN